MPASKFKHNLARLRKHLGLTQDEVAKLVGCSRIAIQSIELGKLTLSDSMAAKLGGALGVPADWLLKARLGAAIPEPLRAQQAGAESYAWRLGTACELWHVVTILERLKSDQEHVLFRHYTTEYIKTLQKAFGGDYPIKGVSPALKYLSRFFDELHSQMPAEVPQKAQRRTRQSA